MINFIKGHSEQTPVRTERTKPMSISGKGYKISPKYTLLWQIETVGSLPIFPLILCRCAYGGTSRRIDWTLRTK